jgi:hypothetical protein
MFKDSTKAIGASVYGGQTLVMNASVHSLFSFAEVSCGQRQTGNSSPCPVSTFLFWSRTQRTISRAVISRPFFDANAVYLRDGGADAGVQRGGDGENGRPGSGSPRSPRLAVGGVHPDDDHPGAAVLRGEAGRAGGGGRSLVAAITGAASGVLIAAASVFRRQVQLSASCHS